MNDKSNTEAETSNISKADEGTPVENRAVFNIPIGKIKDGSEWNDEKESAIADARQAVVRDTKGWQSIVSILTKNFPEVFTYTDGKSLAVEPAAENLTRTLPTNFAFTPSYEDGFFSMYHVEGLLNQSADLLERCIQNRFEWEERASKSANLTLDIVDYIFTDQIHSDEIASGLYALNYNTSRAEATVQMINASSADYQKAILEHGINARYTMSELNKQSAAAQLQAWLGHVPNYQKPFVGDALDLTFGGNTRTGANHARDAAFVQSFWQYYNQLNGLSIQKQSLSGEASTAQVRQQSHTVRANYDFKDIGFRRRRNDIARRLADLKVYLSTSHNGPLNYSEKMQRIELEFNRDLRDALARLSASRDGLFKIYGYKVDLPKVASENLAETPSTSPLDGLLDESLRWIRNAIAWLIRFQERDISFIQSFSIKALSGEQAWRDGRKYGTFKFNLGEGDFFNLHHLRIRSVQLFIRECGDGLWSARISAPDVSFTIHADRSNQELKQGPNLSSYCGRVGKRDAVRSPDTIGANEFHNFSPYGAWEVELGKFSSTGKSRRWIRDLQIDIEVLGWSS